MDNVRRMRELMERPPTLEQLLGGASVPIICTEGRGFLISLNRRAEAFFGRLTEDVLGEPAADLFVEEVALESGDVEGVLHARCPQGEVPVHATVSFVNAGVGVIWVIQLRELRRRD